MPLVFVHGVNVREGADYHADLKVRDGYFREFAMNGVVKTPKLAKIFNPYWGKNGAVFHWNHASLPGDNYEAFGKSDTVYEEILTEIAPGLEADQDKIALTVARQRSVADAVDLVWAAAAHTDPGDDDAAALAALARQVAGYAEGNPKPAWVGSVTNDDQFLSMLLDEAERWEESTPLRRPKQPLSRASASATPS